MFVTLTALGVAAPAFALEVKLLCSIKLITTYSTGRVERENFTDVIDVSDNHPELRIITQSDKLSSVSTVKTFTLLSVNNNSDTNRWYLENYNQFQGKNNSTSISIDRTTGILFYSRYLDLSDGGRFSQSATGSCEKTDMEKRKF